MTRLCLVSGIAFALLGAWTATAPVMRARTSDLTPAPTPLPLESNADWTPVERDSDGVTMLQVPAGCVQMGMTDDEADQWLADVTAAFGSDPLWQRIRDGLTPQHEICFDAPYWIDRTEVTQAQFATLGGIAREHPHFRGEARPVEAITWQEARDFCALRGARLPTEAEWEYAARGIDGLDYPWGGEFDADLAIWSANSGETTADVGSRPDGASWIGALDMAGNVWEWTSTAYDDLDTSGRFPYPYDAEDGREDPTLTGVARVVRGGSYFFLDQLFLRTDVRDGNDPATRATVIGFRCARDDENIAIGD